MDLIVSEIFEQVDLSLEVLVYLLGIILYQKYVHSPLMVVMIREKQSPNNQFKRCKNKRSPDMSDKVWWLTKAACVVTAFFGFISLFSYFAFYILGDPNAANAIMDLNNLFMQMSVVLLILAIFFDWPRR